MYVHFHSTTKEQSGHDRDPLGCKDENICYPAHHGKEMLAPALNHYGMISTKAHSQKETQMGNEPSCVSEDGYFSILPGYVPSHGCQCLLISQGRCIAWPTEGAP